MKKFLMILLCLCSFAAFSLAGCSSDNNNNKDSNPTSDQDWTNNY